MYTNIRWMIRRDMATVLDIEQQSFPLPWTEEEFYRCLRNRNVIGMVAERESLVQGFMVYELHKNRLELLNFAVLRDSRRTGVGTAMVQKLSSKLSADRRNRITLKVRETNLDAQLFFKAMGFRAISVLRGSYDDVDEDAYLMQRRHKPVVDSLLGEITTV